MARPGANEILRTIVGLLMLANVGCFFYYFIVHRPSTNLVLQAQLSTLARLKEATGHEHVNDTIKHAVKGWNVDDAAVVHNPSIGAAYYQAHGIDHVQLGIAGSPWWSMKRSEEENAGGHLVDVPSGVVPFSGQYWLPWLVAHNLSTTTSARNPLLLPLRIRRDASSTSHHLILPSSLIVAATLNGTVPLLYHTHFHHPPKNIAAASGNNTSSHVDDDHISWF
ncbi:transmembrane protein, putative, partial [Bodo saltans]